MRKMKRYKERLRIARDKRKLKVINLMLNDFKSITFIQKSTGFTINDITKMINEFKIKELLDIYYTKSGREKYRLNI